MSAADVDTRPLEALVRAAFPSLPFAVSPMPGGASTRRYFRVALKDGRFAVGMYVPDGGKAEEIDKLESARRWPFLEVRDLLEAHGVDVPRLYAEDTERGWLLLEDLGDETLANVLARLPEKRTYLYTRAVTDLARAQRELGALPGDCVVRHRAFDEDLLFWELEHFREWGAEARNRPFSKEDTPRYGELARGLAERIASWPRSFTHRDYQSRNLMVRRAESSAPTLVWIDFQDALLGPRAYDLVALLSDSYQTFTTEFVASRLDDFAAARGLDDAGRRALGREFDVVTVQRKLKDAGRFVFIDRTKKNSSFLRYVLPTIEKAMVALERLAREETEMADLLRILERSKVALD